MKMILTVAAAFAAATTTVSAFAQDASGDHHEWRARQDPGPNKSGINSHARAKGDAAKTASCDCAMMQDKAMAADCMAGRHKMGTPSIG